MKRPFQMAEAGYRLRWSVYLSLSIFLAGFLEAPLFAQAPRSLAQPPDVRILEIEGKVEALAAGAQAWAAARTNQVLRAGDRLRTREYSRAALRWTDQSILRLNELSDFQIEAPPPAKVQTGFNLLRGMVYFFHRDKPVDVRFNTRTASAAVRGTEFNLAVDGNGVTVLTLLDGVVELSNDQGQITLQSGEQGIAEPGRPPTRTAVINAINVIQWALYYPAVLDVAELDLSNDERQLLATSLAAYRSGDLLQALAEYPAERNPLSPAEKIYHSALLLAAGQVERADPLLDSVIEGVIAGAGPDEDLFLAEAISQLIAAVKLQNWDRLGAPELATEWLAESYDQQSHAHLEAALLAARKAVERSPQFGHGWVRVAELEFSFGRISETVRALDKSLGLSPRNAQALAMKGFLLSAQNKIPEAILYFERAMAVDGALGNAWLGRGLCRIRQGHSEAGREDLAVAAALEPQRALLRSYLAKAYSNEGDFERAAMEIQLAKNLDARDPTAWLYSALLGQQNNRINEAVRDIEHSQELNENRRVYRSRLLLDQDRAVRGANLANLYRDAGMFDVSVREASRAVNADYANYSAHLFLASSFDQLRDPNRINLRYETPAESEYLIANLLAPVGAGTLSQSISQQEYSKLFERDRLGIISSTEFLSRGAWVQNGAQFGTFGNFSYALEGLYRRDAGQRPNNDFEATELRLQIKQQLTPQDSLYARAIYYDAEGGDVVQYFDRGRANPGFRTKERQEPIVSIGYHREWNPGVHTLFLATRLSGRLSVADPAQAGLFIIKDDGVTPSFVQPISLTEAYHSALEIYSTEAQHIWQQPSHHTLLGARFQIGDFRTHNLQTDPVAGNDTIGFFPTNGPTALQDVRTGFQRLSFYGYHFWQIATDLQLLGGVSYDRIRFPENVRFAPLSEREESVGRISPKAGLIWTPGRNTAVRFAYTRSLAGADIDQTFLLEPSQVAGFNQSFRSIIPESVAGAESGARFETYGVSLEQKFKTGTYLGLHGELLNSEVRHTRGIFEFTGATDFTVPSGTREHFVFREKSLLFTINQLIGAEWSLGAAYRLTQAELRDQFVEVPDTAFLVEPFLAQQRVKATLHQTELHTIYNHPGGFFAQCQALWFQQSNRGFSPAEPGDDFWQFNLLAGYRFPGRRAEIRAGLLNLTDRDYRLEPLTLYNELPRARTFVARFTFNF